VTREELRSVCVPADTHVNYDANVNTTVNKLARPWGFLEKPFTSRLSPQGLLPTPAARVADVPMTVAAVLPEMRRMETASATPIRAKTDLWITLGIID